MSQAPVYPDVNSDDKLWAALAYIPFIWPIIAVIVLLMEDKKNRPFIKYHAVQSLALGVIGVVLSFLCIGFLVFIYMLYLAFDAYQGNYSKVPVVTDFIKNQGWA